MTPINQGVSSGQSVALSSIFSVNGSGITAYQVWFSWPEGGFTADGTVTNNGTPIALDQAVPVSSLSGLQFTGAATPGTDEIWLRAFNGQWSGWTLATLTDQGALHATPALEAGNSPSSSLPALDTVVGFDARGISRGSLTIDPSNNALTPSGLIDGGRGTLIALGDSSTVLVKGVGHVDNGLFV